MNPDSAKWLEKASHSIRAAQITLQEDVDSAAGRAYYAMFYCARALLCDQGQSDFSKHSAVHAAYGERFAKTKVLDPKFHRLLLQSFEKRLKADYGIDTVLKIEDAELLIQQAREFLEAATAYLAKHESDKNS